MEINKETMQIRELSVRQGSNVMVEGDIIIPDVKPDVQEVLLADAAACVKTVEMRSGKLYVSGNVRLQILYTPDGEECELKSMSAVFPFSDTLDIPGGEDMDFTANAATEHIGFSLVNSRKLSMKVIVSVQVRGYKEKTVALISGISNDKIQCRTSEYNVFLPLCEKQSDITVSDLLTVPAHYPDMDEILKTDAWASGAECKIMNGKVMIRGMLHVQTLYIAANEGATVEQVSHEIPFTEIVEAENVDENSHVSVTYCVKELTAAPRGDMNGDTKIIHLDAIVGACLKASGSARETFIDDCYSTDGAVETKMRKTAISEFVAQETASFAETQQVSLPKGVKAGEILSVSCKPILRETVFENGMLHMNGTLVTFLLYREEKEDGKGSIRSAITETQFHRTKPVAGKRLSADCDLWTEDAAAERMGDGTVEVRATLGLNCCILRLCDVEYITECEWQEKNETTSDRPALIIYFIQEGDTLWNVAKKYCTTVEKIKTANGLESDQLTIGKKILIPKAC